ncbi:protein of unknown function [Hyphomicrobium sp. MC1]|nr:protein of unknown function [Hyphomicrobium sp. MC1]
MQIANLGSKLVASNFDADEPLDRIGICGNSELYYWTGKVGVEGYADDF